MKKILYHGSEQIIEKPQFGKGMRTNDYGRGFYCTENLELAKEWACANNTNGFANQYELNMTGMSVLDLTSSEYHILNWLAILADNRTYWERSSISEQARKYRQSKREQADISDLYMLDIMREGMKNGDTRLL